MEADGFRIRYLEAGQGPALVCLHGAGGPRLSAAHDLLAECYRVIVFEVPGFGQSPVNERSGSMRELAGTMAEAVGSLGIERYSLMGTSFGGKLALWMAVQLPERLETLVLFGTEDRMIPPAMGRIYRESLPSCHFVLVYDAGHAIDADRPEAFASVVGDFLARRESFVVTKTSGLIHP